MNKVLNGQVVLYPLLLGIYPVLALYAHNMHELSLSVVGLPLVAALGAAIVLFLLSWALVRDATKAGIIAAILLVIFFADGHMHGLLREWGWVRPARYLPIAWGIFLVVCTYFTVGTHRSLHNVTKILSIIAVTVVLLASVRIGLYELSRPGYEPQSEAPTVTLSLQGDPPDIYYIVPDAYGRADIFTDHYGLDNSEFIDYLTSKGFYVACRSSTNWVSTLHSLAVSLNMEYIGYLSDEMGEDATDTGPLVSMVQNPQIVQLLRSAGYKYLHVGSSWDVTGTRLNRHADMNFHTVLVNEFHLLLYNTTILHRVPGVADRVGLISDPRALHYECALRQFERLAQIVDMKDDIEDPLFVFAHVVIPHIPHVFDEDGSFVTREEEVGRSNPENYINQVQYTNELLTTLIDRILTAYSTSDSPPVIILQGDHGPGSGTYSDYHHALSDEDRIRANMGILNAYHLPGGGKDALYESITPVNTFRVVFNHYFGTDYEILGDRNYVSSWGQPYAYYDVTETLQDCAS